jgi:hypothetical protein
MMNNKLKINWKVWFFATLPIAIIFCVLFFSLLSGVSGESLVKIVIGAVLSLILSPLVHFINKLVVNIHSKTFNTVAEAYEHIATRLAAAKSQVCDVSLGTQKTGNPAEKEAFSKYKRAMITACQAHDMKYWEVSCLTDPNYIERSKILLSGNNPYFLRRIDINNDAGIAVPLFIIIDEEVICGFIWKKGKRRNVQKMALISTKEAGAVSVFKDYFWSLWGEENDPNITLEDIETFERTNKWPESATLAID